MSRTARPVRVGLGRAARRRRRRAAPGRSRWRGRMCRRCAGAVLVVVGRAGAASRRTASPGRCDDVEQHRVADREAATSAARARRRRSRSKVGSAQPTKPSGGFLRTTLRRFFGSSPALARRLLVLDHVLGRLHDDVAGGVEAGAPGAAGDLVELAGLQQPRAACRRTWSAPVNSTVRIGTLMPTPRVSVPQMTLSRPAWASCLHQPPVPAAACRRGGRRCRAGPAGTASGRTRR